MSTAPILSAAPHAMDSTTSSPPSATDPAGLNNMFLQLLVAQLKNQSPLNPMDPSQFVGQLAQFSELSTVTSIYQLLQQTVGSGSTGSGSGSSSSSSTSGSGSNGSPSGRRTSIPAGTSAAIPAAATSNSPAPASNHEAMHPIQSADFNQFQGGF